MAYEMAMLVRRMGVHLGAAQQTRHSRTSRGLSAVSRAQKRGGSTGTRARSSARTP